MQKNKGGISSIILVIIIVVVIIAAAIAIGLTIKNSNNTNNSNNNGNSNSSNSNIVNNNENANTSSGNSNGGVQLNSTYKVPMENIYVDVPNWQEIEEGYTEIFIIHESRFVALTCAFESTAENAKDAHDKAFAKLIQNMENYEGGVNSVNITKEETTTINGIEVYSFEGEINYGVENIYNGYAKGYSFIMDGIPCEIIGSVTDDSQSDELIQEVADTVDAMMQSVRSER